MSHYLDGEAGQVFVKMYAGRAVGMSFPTDGNKHYDAWASRKYPVLIDGKECEITIHTYETGELISIEVNLPESITSLGSKLD